MQSYQSPDERLRTELRRVHFIQILHSIAILSLAIAVIILKLRL